MAAPLEVMPKNKDYLCKKYFGMLIPKLRLTSEVNCRLRFDCGQVAYLVLSLRLL